MGNLNCIKTGKEMELWMEESKAYFSDINLLLLDRILQTGRQMRKGGPPGAITPACAKSSLYGPEACMADSPSNPLKRDMILAYLMFREDGAKQREIADQIGVSPSTLSEMIGRLVRDHYVVRRDVPGDRRTKILLLTQEGHSRAQCIMQEVTRSLKVFFRNLDQEEKAELIRLLDKLMGKGLENETPPGTG